jgi:hypothetical protein
VGKKWIRVSNADVVVQAAQGAESEEADSEVPESEAAEREEAEREAAEREAAESEDEPLISQVQVSQEEQLRILRTRVIMMHNRWAAAQALIMYDRLDENLTEEAYEEAISHHSRDLANHRAQLPIDQLHDAIEVLKESKAAFRKAQVVMQDAEYKAAVLIKQAEAHVSAERKRVADTKAGPSTKRTKKV